MDSQEPFSQSETETYLAGFVMSNIVDVKHYSDIITDHEMVGLIREPLNPYDSNAIKVLNTQSLQVGYIERSVVVILSPLIDASLIHIEAIVQTNLLFNNNNIFRIPCQIHVFTHFSAFDVVHYAFHRFISVRIRILLLLFRTPLLLKKLALNPLRQLKPVIKT